MATAPTRTPDATHEADTPARSPKRVTAPTVEDVSAGGCTDSFADTAEGTAVGLTATYWLDADPTPGSVTIRFAGRRAGTTGQDPLDSFELTEQVAGLAPGSGRTSITTKVVGINPGEWQITAEPVAGDTGTGRPATTPPSNWPSGSPTAEYSCTPRRGWSPTRESGTSPTGASTSTRRRPRFYDTFSYGDIVQVTGTSTQLAPDDGYGDWNIGWDQWVKGSALA